MRFHKEAEQEGKRAVHGNWEGGLISVQIRIM